MPEDDATSDVPLFADQSTREKRYADAERTERPYFGVERYEESYAVTYDLLPAGSELALPARRELDERLTAALESVVADADRPTTEVTRSISESLGTVSGLEREDTAREVASVIATIVLDDANWTEATPVGGHAEADLRRND